MAPKPKLYQHNGKDMTAADLAKIRGCTAENMRHLIRAHGFPDAMTRPIMPTAGKSCHNQMIDASAVKITPFDKLLEKKREIEHWTRSLGMSIDEVKVKLKLAREAAL